MNIDRISFFAIVSACLLAIGIGIGSTHKTTQSDAEFKYVESDAAVKIVKRQSALIIRLCARTNACIVNLQTNEIEIKQE